MPQGVSIFLLLNWRGVSIMPTIDMTATGTNIKNLIKQKGMTITDVQKIFGFNNPGAIYKWFHGAALPTIDNLVVLAAALDIKIDDIFVLN